MGTDNRLNNAAQIAEGYYNLLKKKLKISTKEIEQLATYRLDKCNSCTDNYDKENDTCNLCGCNMEAKTRVKGAKCPIGKW